MTEHALSARRLPDGTVEISRTDTPTETIIVTAQAWDEFLAGVRAGGFNPAEGER